MANDIPKQSRREGSDWATVKDASGVSLQLPIGVKVYGDTNSGVAWEPRSKLVKRQPACYAGQRRLDSGVLDFDNADRSEIEASGGSQ